jgi:hypothetical protein
MITNEAVEAAAKVSYEHLSPRTWFPSPYGEASEQMQHTHITLSRAMLEAAAPFMQRIINTIEELVELPSGSVILDENGVCVKEDDDEWLVPFSVSVFTDKEISLPATLLLNGRLQNDYS